MASGQPIEARLAAVESQVEHLRAATDHQQAALRALSGSATEIEGIVRTLLDIAEIHDATIDGLIVLRADDHLNALLEGYCHQPTRRGER